MAAPLARPDRKVFRECEARLASPDLLELPVLRGQEVFPDCLEKTYAKIRFSEIEDRQVIG